MYNNNPLKQSHSVGKCTSATSADMSIVSRDTDINSKVCHETSSKEGDVIAYLRNLTINIDEALQIFSELHAKLTPILSVEPEDSCGDIQKPESAMQLAPLATDLKELNDKMHVLKFRMLQDIRQIQL